MGYVSTVIVYHDELHNIQGDPNFGSSVAAACTEAYRAHGKQVPIAGGHSLNAARVVDVVHSSQTSVLAVSGSGATVIGHRYGGDHRSEEAQVEILRAIASKLGYDIRRKPST